MSKKLTVEEGLVIQSRHLSEWKQLLKPSVFKKLSKIVKVSNPLAKDGYDITRGQSISNILNVLVKTKAMVDVVYPLENREDFFKFVVMDEGKVLRDFDNKEMYFDSLELAQNVCDAYNKVYFKDENKRPRE